MGIFGQLDPTGIVGGGLSLISQKMASNADWKSLQAQNQWAKEAAKQQFTYDTEAWKRQNEYNSPEQVMERYKAAGLNPNLIYGGGVGNTAGTAPAQQVAPQNMKKRTPINMGGVLGNFQDTELKRVNIDNARKQGELLEKQKLIKTAEAAEASRYFRGRGYQAYSKGQEGLQRWSWLQETGDQDKSKGYAMLDSQLSAREYDVKQKIQRILNMQTDLEYKKTMLEYYDWNQLFKYASPAVGIINKFAKGSKAATAAKPIAKGVSEKFRYNSPRSWEKAGY